MAFSKLMKFAISKVEALPMAKFQVLASTRTSFLQGRLPFDLQVTLVIAWTQLLSVQIPGTFYPLLQALRSS